MDLKRFFGTILTVLGIGGLIYAAVLFVNTTDNDNIRALATYGILGLIFFLAGLGLIRNVKD